MTPSEHGKLGNAENGFALGETSVSPALLPSLFLRGICNIEDITSLSCTGEVVLIGLSSLDSPLCLLFINFIRATPNSVAANLTVTSLVLSVLHPCGLNFFSYVLTVGQYSLC